MDENQTKAQINIRDYLDLKFGELEKRLELRDRLTDKALMKAESTLAIRLESMNEFRMQLKSQAGTFITREEFEIHMRRTEDKIAYLTKIIYIGIGALAVVQLLIRYTPNLIG